MKINHKAFTLAEVLITLGIIGIVAAMTLPIVINYATRSAFKVWKAYNWNGFKKDLFWFRKFD